MTHYCIGDVHGCFRTLEALLEQVSFDPAGDRIWFTGDLVNRGPRSLEVLRWVFEHRECVDSVLGNHDIHALARRLGLREPHRLDTLDELLAAPDCDELLDWLRRRPLILEAPGVFLVHAGLHPAWSLENARSMARELEQGLSAPGYSKLIKGYSTTDDSELVQALRTMTLVRRCTGEGERCPDPEKAGEPSGCRAWFEHRELPEESTIVTGHWARLGYFRTPGLVSLDSGCVWGNSLSAVRIDPGHIGAPGSMWQQRTLDETGLLPPA